MNKISPLAVSAAVCTGMAGILHLSMLPAFNQQMTILFLIGGLAQVFWILPTIKDWGRIWDCIGIVGTVAFITLWILTRIPDNPITGRGGMIGDIAIATEIFQLTFVALMAVVVYARHPKAISKIQKAK